MPVYGQILFVAFFIEISIPAGYRIMRLSGRFRCKRWNKVKIQDKITGWLFLGGQYVRYRKNTRI